MPQAVSRDVLEVLSRSTLAGHVLTLPPALERDLYLKTDKVVQLAGGKWKTRVGHVFAGDAAEAIEPIILTGEVSNEKKELEQFFTPMFIAQRMADLARVEEGCRVLEPSAGGGILARVAAKRGAHVTAIEVAEGLCAALVREPDLRGQRIIHGDFLAVSLERDYDVVLMNPPFRGEVMHVLHAYAHLRPGGRLVSVMSSGITFRQDKAYTALREFIEARGKIRLLPDDTFISAGTRVRTVLIDMTA